MHPLCATMHCRLSFPARRLGEVQEVERSDRLFTRTILVIGHGLPVENIHRTFNAVIIADSLEFRIPASGENPALAGKPNGSRLDAKALANLVFRHLFRDIFYSVHDAILHDGK